MLNHGCEVVDLIVVGCVKSKRYRAGPGPRRLQPQPFGIIGGYMRSCMDVPGTSSVPSTGLLAPGTWIERYDLSLADLSTSERREWSLGVLNDLATEVPTLDGKCY